MSITGFNIDGNIEKYDYESLDNKPDISGGGSGEVWEELVNVTLEENALPILDIGDYTTNFKKLRYIITVDSMTPKRVSFVMSIPNATIGDAYIIGTVNNFGNESGKAIAFVEFEPLIAYGFCKYAITWAALPCLSTKVSSISYQYNSHDYKRLLTARYFRTAQELPAGTSIIIKGVRVRV